MLVVYAPLMLSSARLAAVVAAVLRGSAAVP